MLVKTRDKLCDYSVDSRQFYLFDVRKRKYVEMPRPNLPRNECAYAAVGGCLYIFGGIRAVDLPADRYDDETDRILDAVKIDR